MLAVIVNPNNPNGGTFDMTPLPALLRRYPETYFLVDEAFIGLAGQSVQHEEKIRARKPATRLDRATGLGATGARRADVSDGNLLHSRRFAPHDAATLAEQLRQRGILIKPLNDPHLGAGFMRVTTARPDENRQFVKMLQDVM